MGIYVDEYIFTSCSIFWIYSNFVTNINICEKKNATFI